MNRATLCLFGVLNWCLNFSLSAQPLQLIDHFPLPNATEVASLSPIQLHFNKPVSDTSLWKQLRVDGHLYGRYDFNAVWRNNNRELDLLPAQPYAERERITVTLPRGFFSTQDTSAKSYVFSFNAATSPNAIAFQHQIILPLDSLFDPIMLVPHDLNRDHRLDLVLGNNSPPNPLKAVPIGVFLATDETARFKAFFKNAGFSPCCLLASPLDKDYWSDLAVTESIGDSLHIFKVMDGEIIQKRSYPTPDRSVWLQTIDYDLDGDNDLVSGSLSKGIRIFVNDGNGNFDNIYPIGSGLASRSGNAADMDNDGDLDLVVGEIQTQPSTRDLLRVYFNEGNGKFLEGNPISNSGYTILVYPVDLNRDGFLDVLSVVAFRLPTIEIFLNDQLGGLLPLTQFQPPGSSFAVATFVDFGDFNHDGWLDFACAISGTISHPDSSVLIYTNQEGKNFLHTSTLIIGKEPKGLAVADLNNDQLLDLAVVSSQSRKLHLFFGEKATGVDDKRDELPTTWELGKAYPNPFSETTTVAISKLTSWVRAEVFDTQGRLVLSQKLLPDFNASAQFRWDGRDQRGQPTTNGVYLIKVQHGRQAATTKVVLMR